jgi:class 3 adenylate cyclase
MEARAKTVGFDFVWVYSANRLFPDYDRPLLAALSLYRDRVVLARSKQQFPATPYLAAMRFDAGGVGLGDLPVDPDGAYRRVPLNDPTGGEPSHTFAAAILQRAGVMALPREIVLAPIYHPERISAYALVDVLRCAKAAPKVVEEVFKGKIVLVGSTLAEEDRKMTTGRYLEAPIADSPAMHPCGLRQLGASVPGSPTVPGVFLHTAAIDSVLSGHVTRVAAPILVAALAALSAVVGGSAGLLLPPLLAAASTVTVAVLLFGGAVASLANDWWIPIGVPLVSLLLSPLVASVVRSFIEEAARRQLQQEMYFLTGLSRTMLDRIACGEDVLRVEGQQADVTVMFADLSGFTKLSTEVQPAVFVAHCRQALASIVQEIETTGGWVNQFLGDCVMAIWGAPLQDPDHAVHAVQAALAASRRIADTRHAYGKNDPRGLDVKIGVNSGPASIGKFGSGGRGAYTAAGSTVNLAARIAQIPPQYGCRIVLGAETAERVKTQFLIRELDRIRLKDVLQPLSVFEPLDGLLDSSAQQVDVDRYAEALSLYRKRRFVEAAEIWEAIGEHEVEQRTNPSRIMARRARLLVDGHFSDEGDLVWDVSAKQFS